MSWHQLGPRHWRNAERGEVVVRSLRPGSQEAPWFNLYHAWQGMYPTAEEAMRVADAKAAMRPQPVEGK